MITKLCENLKSLRTRHNYSFKDLEKLMAAKNCKVTASTLQRYETGKIPNVPYDSIIALSEIYQVPPNALMGWADLPILSPDEQTLLADFRKLNAAGRTIAAATVKSFTLNPEYTE